MIDPNKEAGQRCEMCKGKWIDYCQTRFEQL